MGFAHLFAMTETSILSVFK